MLTVNPRNVNITAELVETPVPSFSGALVFLDNVCIESREKGYGLEVVTKGSRTLRG